MLIVGEEAWILWIGIAEIYIKRFSRQALYTISLFIFLGDCDGICHCTTNVGIEMLCWAQHIDSICLVMKLSPQLLMVPHKSMCSTREYQNIQVCVPLACVSVLSLKWTNCLLPISLQQCSKFFMRAHPYQKHCLQREGISSSIAFEEILQNGHQLLCCLIILL